MSFVCGAVRPSDVFRSKMLSTRDIGDGRTTVFEVLWSGAILTAVHQHAELILDALGHIEPVEVLVQKLGIGNGNEPWGMGGNGIEKDIPAHLYSKDKQLNSWDDYFTS